MAIIARVKIDGFWGDKNIALSLKPDVNFIIGVNGSGKTTLINTIAAVLNVDFPTLDRIPFKTVTLVLTDKKNRKKPVVIVTKKSKSPSPFPSLEYSIAESAKSRPMIFRIDEIEEARHFRHLPPREIRRSLLRKQTLDITERLNDLAPSTWLSIHRATGNATSREDRNLSFESSVDKKLSEISHDLSRFFSELQTQTTEKIRQFQQSIFLSLLSYRIKAEGLFGEVQKYNLGKERKLLAEIFESFRIPAEKYQGILDDHFKRLSASLKSIKESNVDLQDLIAPQIMMQIHPIVQKWNELTQEQEKIVSPRESFLKVVNNMVQRKKLVVNDKNELVAITQSGKLFALDDLSSGEKQLLIILGEALLQRESPRIYIADEPELSLHVSWQQVLVSNLRKINPNAQIIFATHSPDIVSEFNSNVQDMEKILS